MMKKPLFYILHNYVAKNPYTKIACTPLEIFYDSTNKKEIDNVSESFKQIAFNSAQNLAYYPYLLIIYTQIC